MPPSSQGAAPDIDAPEMELEVPARSVYVGVVRMALGSVARQAGLDEEKVEDIRMAVSEACANLVLTGDEEDSAASMKVSWRDGGDRFDIDIVATASAPAPDPGAPSPEGDRLAMSQALLRSLVHEYAVENTAGGALHAHLTFLP